jgi:hypothetical protein
LNGYSVVPVEPEYSSSGISAFSISPDFTLNDKYYSQQWGLSSAKLGWAKGYVYINDTSSNNIAKIAVIGSGCIPHLYDGLNNITC